MLVFPDDEVGDGTGYGARIDSVTTEKIKRWVRDGGVFVGLKGGAAWATAGRSGLSKVAIKPDKDPGAAEGDDESGDSDDQKARELARKLATVEDREKQDRLARIPGTILRVKLDPGHPLAYGYGREVRILKTGKMLFELSPDGRNVGTYPEDPRVSGYVSDENIDRMIDTPFLVEETLGRGRVILYNDDPNFRVFWYGLNRLFLNSLFFARVY